MNTLKRILILLAVVFSIASCSNSNSREDMLVGTWNLISYSDNAQRTPQQLAAHQQLVANLKIKLDIFDDGGFERNMTQGAPPQTQTIKNDGKWFLENEDQILTMEVKGADPSKLLIVELSEQKLVLRVEEEGISTTLTFSK